MHVRIPNPEWLKNPKDTPDDPLTWERLMEWTANTGFVLHQVRRRLSALDFNFRDDYVQEVWVEILSVPKEKMMEIWYKGKGKYTNYLKAIILNQIVSKTSKTYRKYKIPQKTEMLLTEEAWMRFEDADEETDASLYFPVRCLKDDVTKWIKYDEEKIKVRCETELTDTNGYIEKT